MRRFIFFLLFLVLAVSVEALYRWSNILEITWDWLIYRVVFYGFLLSAHAWFAYREAKKEELLKESDDLWTAILLVLFGGAGSLICGWRVFDALQTGQVLASSTPERLTAWAMNPWGFSLALGVSVLGTLMFLAMIIGGTSLIWVSVVRWRNPAGLDESADFGS